MKMKSLYRLAILVAACTFTSTLFAQSNMNLRVTVPFNFVAEGSQFSAGDYQITQLTENVLLLHNLNDHSSAVAKTVTTSSEPTVKGRNVLAFQRFGEEYFLENVTTRLAQSTYQLWISPRETRLAKANPAAVDVVSIAAHDGASGGK